jgi:hypothetical protein
LGETSGIRKRWECEPRNENDQRERKIEMGIDGMELGQNVRMDDKQKMKVSGIDTTIGERGGEPFSAGKRELAPEDVFWSDRCRLLGYKKRMLEIGVADRECPIAARLFQRFTIRRAKRYGISGSACLRMILRMPSMAEYRLGTGHSRLEPGFSLFQ